jgi:actin-related protein 3
MGYAGNSAPDYIVETKIVNAAKTTSQTPDLEFWVGIEALQRAKTDTISNVISEGIISDWDNIEKYWQRCLFQYMRCDPEEHYVLLTEPPLNPPENREYTAEIMFETFNVPGLYIGVQAVLALIASRLSKGAEKILTGSVIDSGDGVTHVIPVVDGYVIGSCIKHIPLAGSNITSFMLRLMEDRGETIPRGSEREILARRIKEQFCYVCPDMLNEFQKYDQDPTKFQMYNHNDTITGQPYTVEVGYERFVGPELFFNPSIFDDQFSDPLSVVVDNTIQGCPIDTRRRLYRNIVLSGGSTMFKDFHRRLQRDINRRCKERYDLTLQNLRPGAAAPAEIEVKVIQHRMQRFAVWFGGSMLGTLPQFYEMAHSREQYEEIGPSVARHNAMFQGI